MKVTVEQQKEIFEELDRLSNIENEQEPQPEEFTARDYELHTGRSFEWTRRKLIELCADGKLERRKYKGKFLYKIKG